MKIIAIDPGPIQSAYVIWDGISTDCFNIIKNQEVLERFKNDVSKTIDILVIEKVACYGMPVGESIFETVYWSGRFSEAFNGGVHRLPRKDVKMHLCGSMRAKDSNITQALVDRFAPYTSNKGKGKKADPGFFYGFKKDIWQAMALAVTYWDTANR